jgi:hypothetical protein
MVCLVELVHQIPADIWTSGSSTDVQSVSPLIPLFLCQKKKKITVPELLLLLLYYYINSMPLRDGRSLNINSIWYVSNGLFNKYKNNRENSYAI